MVASTRGEATMPVDSIVFVSGVSIVFVVLAVVLAWGAQRTSGLYEHWD